jgi:hypothetical protein
LDTPGDNPPPPNDVNGWLEWTTPPRTLKYATIIDVAGRTSAALRIKATSDACILLSDDGDSLATEILIGGWSNTRTVIRDRPQFPHVAERSTPGVLSPAAFRDFWVAWSETTVTVGTVGAVVYAVHVRSSGDMQYTYVVLP